MRDLALPEVAELLGLEPVTLESMASAGDLPAYKMEGHWHFSRTELEAWVLQHNPALLQKAPGELLGAGRHRLYRALHHGGVYAGVKGRTKEEVIGKVVHELAARHQLDAEGVTRLLLQREEIPCALNEGIAIPHTRDFYLSHQDLVVVAYPERSIPYGALDGKPVHTLFFLFASEDRHHLDLMAKIAHFCHCPKKRTFLQEHPNKSRLLEEVYQWESQLRPR